MVPLSGRHASCFLFVHVSLFFSFKHIVVNTIYAYIHDVEVSSKVNDDTPCKKFHAQQKYESQLATVTSMISNENENQKICTFMISNEYENQKICTIPIV